MLQQVPGPPALPVLGNVLDVRNEVPINGLANLADKYGPIYKLMFGGKETYIVSNCKLLEELCDDSRFSKVPPDGLKRTKRPGPSGLFAAEESDPDWGQAHRVLMPAFGPLAIGEMFDEMHDIATQLILKWARMGPDNKIPVTNDFTRLTLDTIALCAMDFRFNSFYQDGMHPFVEAMTRVLTAGNSPSTLWDVVKAFSSGLSKSVVEDQQLMLDTARNLVKTRREKPSQKKDLLNAMINGKDSKTGEGMRDDLISANMITFLIAGHETTSGMLSFAFAQLLKNPAAYRAAQAEVDKVVGDGQIKLEHMKDLKYLNAVLRETLRLSPTVPAFFRQVRSTNSEDPPSLGGYEVKKDRQIIALISKSQKDAEVYGEDANEFKPERMLDENFEKIPKSAWKPFGTGVRACIGRPFAWQEALLMTALILQVFDLRLDDPSYELRVKQTLTIKPRDLFMKASLRKGMDATRLNDLMSRSSAAPPMTNGALPSKKAAPTEDESKYHGLKILYGSNTGTCETLAQRLAADAPRYNYHATVTDMDSAVSSLSKDVPTVIVTASYEGQPADNAAHFVSRLTSSDKAADFADLKYAVFGCGHSDWAATFQHIPTVVDETLKEKKGERLVPRGSADAAKGDIFGDFDQWADEIFWPAMKKTQGSESVSAQTGGSSSNLEVDLSHGNRAAQLRHDVQEARVQDSRVLTAPGEPEKRHLEILLPSDVAYEPGDYLVILPLNPEATIKRVMTRYQIPWDATITIKAKGPTTLPKDTPISVFDLLKGYVELSQPATKKDLITIRDSTTDPTTKTSLATLTTNFSTSLLPNRTTILDVLERHPHATLPFPTYLSTLPPMRLRYYSISSSPLFSPSTCTITYSVLSAPSLTDPSTPYIGAASTYLQSLKPSDPIQIAVRSSNKQFRLPLQADKTPILMLCAGTGLAPFRGFVQQRAEMLKGDPKRKLAPAILIIGCRSNHSDRLYAEELDAWSKLGAVDVRYAFSQEPEHELAQGCRHVQDRMVRDKLNIFELWDQGAKVFICGSSGLAKGVGKVSRELVIGRMEADGKGGEGMEEKVEKWVQGMRNERFVTDVFT